LNLIDWETGGSYATEPGRKISTICYFLNSTFLTTKNANEIKAGTPAWLLIETGD